MNNPTIRANRLSSLKYLYGVFNTAHTTLFMKRHYYNKYDRKDNERLTLIKRSLDNVYNRYVTNIK